MKCLPSFWITLLTLSSGTLSPLMAQELKDRPILVLNASGHTDGAPRIAFTADGRTLISVSKDKTIRVWDVATGESTRVLRPPIGPGRLGTLYALSIAPDGRLLAVGGVGPKEHEAWIYLVSFPEGQIVRTLRGHTNTVIEARFSPDGKRVASCGDDTTARIWDVSTGRCEHVLRGHTRPVYDLAFAPDGQQLVTASFDGTARIWSADTGTLQRELKDPFKGRLYWMRSVAWSPDGQTIATGSFDGVIRLWTAQGDLRQRHGPLGGHIQSLDFDRDSRKLLFTNSLSGRPPAILDLETGREAVSFNGHLHGQFKGKLSPDGRLAVTAGYQGEELYLWNSSDGQLVHHLGGQSRTTWSVGWAREGSTIGWGASGIDRNDNPQYPLERSFRLSDLELTGFPGNDFLRSQLARGSLRLQHVPREDGVAVYDGQEPINTLRFPLNPPKCCTFLTDDQIAIGTIYNLYLFEARSGRQLRDFVGHTGDVRAVAPSPNGRYLLSASSDQTLRIWTADRNEPILSLFFAGTDWIAWTPEGYYAASPGGETLMGWQVNNGADEMGTFYPAAQFRKSLYRPDAIKRLLAAGSVEKALELADRERGKASQHVEVGDVLPPQVQITTPSSSRLEVTGPTVEISFVVRSVGKAPITTVRLFVDGRPYPGSEFYKTYNPPRQGELRESWTFKLDPGAHSLAVQAESSVSRALSEPVEVVFGRGVAREDAGGQDVTAKVQLPSLYVLAVGVSDYPGNMKLNYAADDAKALAEVYQEHSKALYRRVEVKLIVDKGATRRNILQGLTWLRKQMTQNDVAVISFAGHGAKDQDGTFYLLPVDVDMDDLLSTAVPGDQIKRTLASRSHVADGRPGA